MSELEHLGTLIAGAREGDVRAREQLVRAWLPAVLGWCVRLGGPLIDPEETAQDVFMIVLDKVHKVFDPERFPSWLFGVTRRVIARNRRRVWMRRWAPGGLPELADEGRDPERSAAVSELGRKVQQALEELPARQREVLVLCDLEERSASEVAALLGIPTGTVKSRLRLARRKLRAVGERMGLDAAVCAGGGV